MDHFKNENVEKVNVILESRLLQRPTGKMSRFSFGYYTSQRVSQSAMYGAADVTWWLFCNGA